MNTSSLVHKYMRWKEREKWLLLRRIAYEQLRDRFFSSPKSIDNISLGAFKRHYLGFGTVDINGFKYKLTVSTIPSFLRNYNVSKLEKLIKEEKIEVLGNASWSQLHMGFRNEKWPDVKKSIKHLLFDEQRKSVSDMSENEIIERLGRVLEGDMAVPGFGRAKVTPLLLICDRKGRFGVWNSVSDDALDRLGLKPRSDITQSRRISDYTLVNKALKELKETHGFRDLVDVDLFVWYFLEETEASPLIETKPKAIVEPLDPYLTTIREKIEEAEHYLQEERIFPETIVKLSYEVVMHTLKRRIIDLKGVKLVEDLRRQKKLYFDTLVGILRKEGEPIESHVHLELLRDLRNRVEHEAFKATKQNAIWAYNVAKNFIQKRYPQVFAS